MHGGNCVCPKICRAVSHSCGGVEDLAWTQHPTPGSHEQCVAILLHVTATANSGIPAELSLPCRTSCSVAYRNACLRDALAPSFHARFKTDLRSASARWCLGNLRILAGISAPGPSSWSSRAVGMPVLLEASSSSTSASSLGRLSCFGCSGFTAGAAWGVATWFATHLRSTEDHWC